MNAIVEKRLQAINETEGEKFTLPSLTVPDDSLSIQEILINFTRGTMPPLSKLPQYGTEEDNEAFLDTDHPLDNETIDLANRDIAKAHYDALLADAMDTHGAPFEATEKPKSETTVKKDPTPPPAEE
ncbi:MAG: hypothetical protein QW260_08335 [Thermoproteota archaeon]